MNHQKLDSKITVNHNKTINHDEFNKHHHDSHTSHHHLAMAHGDPRLHVHQRQFPGGPKGCPDGELRHAVLVAAAVVVHGLVVLGLQSQDRIHPGVERELFHKKKGFHQ